MFWFVAVVIGVGLAVVVSRNTVEGKARRAQREFMARCAQYAEGIHDTDKRESYLMRAQYMATHVMCSAVDIPYYLSCMNHVTFELKFPER